MSSFEDNTCFVKNNIFSTTKLSKIVFALLYYVKVASDWSESECQMLCNAIRRALNFFSGNLSVINTLMQSNIKDIPPISILHIEAQHDI